MNERPPLEIGQLVLNDRIWVNLPQQLPTSLSHSKFRAKTAALTETRRSSFFEPTGSSALQSRWFEDFSRPVDLDDILGWVSPLHRQQRVICGVASDRPEARHSSRRSDDAPR